MQGILMQTHIKVSHDTAISKVNELHILYWSWVFCSLCSGYHCNPYKSQVSCTYYKKTLWSWL